jgi:hypothetical protein
MDGPRLSTRIAVALTIGVSSGLFCWYLLGRFHQGAADFHWAIHGAQRLLSGLNPYDTPLEQYPVTAMLFAVPFLRIDSAVAAGLFFGLSSGLLALGLTRYGFERLLVFLAYPYWAAILTAQWSPLIMASAFFPILLPATMAKPQVGLPIVMTRLTRRGFAACLLWGILSFLALPRWPWLWVHQFGGYQHFIPLLVLPGPLIVFALWRYRESDAWLILVSAILPQRWFFDSFILWLIPKTRRHLLLTAFASWGVGIWRWYHTPSSFAQVGRWTVLFIYLPMTLLIVARPYFRRFSVNSD